MSYPELTWLNSIVLLIVLMVSLVMLYGVARELRRVGEGVGRVEDTAKEIAKFLAEKLA